MPHPAIRPFDDADLDAVVTVFQRSVREIASDRVFIPVLATVEAAIVAGGLDAVHMEASLTAQAFFGACGFRVVEKKTVLRNGQAFRRARMRKDGLPASCGATGLRSDGLLPAERRRSV